MEQAQLFETADERGCTPMFGAAHRRASAVPCARRYEVARWYIASELSQATPSVVPTAPEREELRQG